MSRKMWFAALSSVVLIGGTSGCAVRPAYYEPPPPPRAVVVVEPEPVYYGPAVVVEPAYGYGYYRRPYYGRWR